MKKKMIIFICILGGLLESYFIIYNYLNGVSVITNVILGLGFLGALFLNFEKKTIKN